ncbi:MAG: hypothetical protein P8077_09365, partial [Gammaproteobacteria bacterium]
MVRFIHLLVGRRVFWRVTVSVMVTFLMFMTGSAHAVYRDARFTGAAPTNRLIVKYRDSVMSRSEARTYSDQHMGKVAEKLALPMLPSFIRLALRTTVLPVPPAVAGAGDPLAAARRA